MLGFFSAAIREEFAYQIRFIVQMLISENDIFAETFESQLIIAVLIFQLEALRDLKAVVFRGDSFRRFGQIPAIA
ncbi:MAG: hypothetical protein J6U00_12790 [Ruminococcus sp.]|uniref:hypothetical protein n=1 Tax=Ruminococcus sp. TaxID=41978 RepID=UPI001B120F2C|nr:hypothetical protein [Ruminococcus sp.]MBO7474849.1 hypothetical protein [Ruminococcus sp.]